MLERARGKDAVTTPQAVTGAPRRRICKEPRDGGRPRIRNVWGGIVQYARPLYRQRSTSSVRSGPGRGGSWYRDLDAVLGKDRAGQMWKATYGRPTSLGQRQLRRQVGLRVLPGGCPV
jgi:hypothetical protein